MQTQYPLILTIFCMPLWLHGCAVGPNYHPPAAPHASRYTYSKLPKKTASVKAGNAGKSQVLKYTQSIPNQWWKLFHSVSLNLLIEQGIKNNPTLQAAKQSLKVAEYTLRAEIGSLMVPSVNLNLGVERTRVVTFQYGIGAGGSIFSIYNTNVATSYTFDLFGGNQRMIEIYRAKVNYENFEMLGAYLTLTSNITTTAVSVASLEAQIKATQELIETERKVLSIQRARLSFGGVALLDVYQQETVLAQTIATLPPLEKTLSKENTALAVLTGQLTTQSPPLHLKLDSLNLPKNLPVSVPSALVQQRPDILAASAMLHEMSAAIGVATANLLPKITLKGSFGWMAPRTSLLFIPATKSWDLAAALLQPIFRGGELIAKRHAAIEQFKQYYDKYQEVVLKAFKNVADSLSAIQLDANKFKEDVVAEGTAGKTLKTTIAQYELGGDNYLSVMTVQQKYLENKLNRIKSQATRYNDTAGLFQALGGGWWDMPVLPKPKVFSTQKLPKPKGFSMQKLPQPKELSTWRTKS